MRRERERIRKERIRSRKSEENGVKAKGGNATRSMNVRVVRDRPPLASCKIEKGDTQHVDRFDNGSTCTHGKNDVTALDFTKGMRKKGSRK